VIRLIDVSLTFNLTRPTLVDGETRELHRPWFASSLAALRAVLLLESPAAFRSRNLFVTENALARARVQEDLSSSIWCSWGITSRELANGAEETIGSFQKPYWTINAQIGLKDTNKDAHVAPSLIDALVVQTKPDFRSKAILIPIGGKLEGAWRVLARLNTVSIQPNKRYQSTLSCGTNVSGFVQSQSRCGTPASPDRFALVTSRGRRTWRRATPGYPPASTLREPSSSRARNTNGGYRGGPQTDIVERAQPADTQKKLGVPYITIYLHAA
jgi:hypothetical protein